MSGRRQFAREIRGVALEIAYLSLQVLAFATEAHHAFEQIRCPGFCGAGENVPVPEK